MKKLFLLALIGLLTASVTTAVSAATDSTKKNEPKVVEVQQLKPESTSEVVLPSLEAIKYSDGSIKIHGTGTKQVNTTAESFKWEVDLNKATYKTTKLDSKKELATAPSGTKSETNPAMSKQSKTGQLGTQATYTGTVQVSTKDPVNWTTCWTKQSLTWNVYSDATVDWSSRSLDYWVGQPTSGDTYWYLNDYYFNGSPYYPSASHGSVVTEATGKYYNYDFWSDSQRTDATHWIQIEGLNTNRYVYDWSATHTGEASYLLRGTVSAY